MPQFTNLNKLLKHIEKNIDATLRDEVDKVARDTMKDKIQTEVYDAYSPSSYERTGELKSDSSIETNVKDGVFSMRNIRSDTEFAKDVASVIEFGRGYTWGTFLDKEIGARPFHYETYKEMESTLSYFNAMKRGLKKRGFDVK